jgi:hypothetical protein
MLRPGKPLHTNDFGTRNRHPIQTRRASDPAHGSRPPRWSSSLRQKSPTTLLPPYSRGCCLPRWHSRRPLARPRCRQRHAPSSQTGPANLRWDSMLGKESMSGRRPGTTVGGPATTGRLSLLSRRQLPPSWGSVGRTSLMLQLRPLRRIAETSPQLVQRPVTPA